MDFEYPYESLPPVAPLNERVDALDRALRNHATHSWLHICFPPKPSRCTFCNVEAGTPESFEPCEIRGSWFT